MNDEHKVCESSFEDYLETFIQRIPRYGVKFKGQTWKTKKKYLANKPIGAHLAGEYAVGVLGKWYPEYAILDIDDLPTDIVQETRDELGLDEQNSMLCGSESKNSYHLLLRPQYNSKPPTIKLLQDSFSCFAKRHGIEIYPQAKRFIRLPFGSHQHCLDLYCSGLIHWENRLYWFKKLDDFDLSMVQGHQMLLDFPKPSRQVDLPLRQYTGPSENELLVYGLQAPSSRSDGQFRVLLHLWRRNIPQDEAERITWMWIKSKHNGFSKDIIKYPKEVRAHIHRQALKIYGNYDQAYIYPDSTHNQHNGYITEPDIRDIIEISQASIPRTRFLFEVVKYFNPRRHRNSVRIHTDKLIQWASRGTYKNRINEFQAKGLIERGNDYLTGKYSKSFKLKWKFRDSREALLYDGRSIDTLEDTVRLLYKPDDFRQLLKNAGGGKRTVNMMVQKTFEVGKKG